MAVYLPDIGSLSIKLDKAIGYLVLWQGRVVAVYKALSSAKSFIRKTQAWLKQLGIGSPVNQTDLIDALSSFITLAGSGAPGFIPVWNVANPPPPAVV